jgi:hypothetical protein
MHIDAKGSSYEAKNFTVWARLLLLLLLLLLLYLYPKGYDYV